MAGCSYNSQAAKSLGSFSALSRTSSALCQIILWTYGTTRSSGMITTCVQCSAWDAQPLNATDRYLMSGRIHAENVDHVVVARAADVHAAVARDWWSNPQSWGFAPNLFAPNCPDPFRRWG